MLTLRELKRIVDVPVKGERIPKAKHLKETGTPVISRRLGGDAQIEAYSNGYALYRVGRHTTVFPIRSCGDYLYLSGRHGTRMPESFFDKEPWYIRLILEGEDRMGHNLDEREQGRTVSYSSLSEEWVSAEEPEKSALELLVRHETVEEMMRILTERQRIVLRAFFLQEKTQKQISKELNISKASVYVIISRSIRRIREVYLEWYQSRRREKYQEERDRRHGICSLDALREGGECSGTGAGLCDGTEELAFKNIRKASLRKMLGELPAQDARLIVLLYFEEITVKAAAELYGCSRKAIQNRRKRILNELLRMIQEDPRQTIGGNEAWDVIRGSIQI